VHQFFWHTGLLQQGFEYLLANRHKIVLSVNSLLRILSFIYSLTVNHTFDTLNRLAAKLMSFYSVYRFWVGDMCLLKLILKMSAIFTITSGGLLHAEELQIEANRIVQSCPQDFHTLPLYPNAKFCQLFNEDLPASMSYFANSDQQSVKNFYINQLDQAEDEEMLKGRIVLQYSDGQKVIVISKDGQGSQIDILIKSAG
jgi:hypothetical protein